MTDLNAKKLKQAQATRNRHVSLEPQPQTPWSPILLIVFCAIFIAAYLSSGV
jgi:hypothetical protein